MEFSRPLWVPFVPTEFGENALCLELANTRTRSVEGSYEGLRSYADLVEWATAVGATSPADGAALLARYPEQPEAASAALEDARDIREAVYQVFSAGARGLAPDPGALAFLERRLQSALSHVRLAAVGAEWQDTSSRLESPLWRPLLSAAELLGSPWLARVRECASDDCGWLFLDLSRNRSRRWCDMKSCGNRSKARAFQSRRRG